MCAQLCLCLSRLEYLFPSVLWKAYNQIPLALKARFSGDSQSLCRIPRLGSLKRASEPSQECENFFDIIVLQSVGMRFDLIVTVSLPLSHCSFFVFGGGVSFSLMDLLPMVAQQLVAILVLLQEMSGLPSTPPSCYNSHLKNHTSTKLERKINKNLKKKIVFELLQWSCYGNVPKVEGQELGFLPCHLVFLQR